MGKKAADDTRHQRILSDQPGDLLKARGSRAVRAVIREALLRLWDDQALSLAGNIAFRAILAMFPFLIFVSSLTAFIGDPGVANHLIEFLIAIVPAPLERDAFRRNRKGDSFFCANQIHHSGR
ncbi:hypothetical protein [Sinorhizobium meliloti]|uniref:hypothetical protein n=1 Tax=Rhizobium meliloti TaxID=382 RepID=UPI001F30F681|nr:hypothetical protein [Sinorhizobium meliloti]